MPLLSLLAFLFISLACLRRCCGATDSSAPAACSSSPRRCSCSRRGSCSSCSCSSPAQPSPAQRASQRLSPTPGSRPGIERPPCCSRALASFPPSDLSFVACLRALPRPRPCAVPFACCFRCCCLLLPVGVPAPPPARAASAPPRGVWVCVDRQADRGRKLRQVSRSALSD